MTTTSAPTSYTLVLPPGWARIPLRHGTDAAVRRILDRSFAGLPRDEVFAYRRELEDGLRQRIAEARKANGLDLYLPVELVHGMALPASFLVSETRTPAAPDVDPREVALFLASEEDGREVVGLDGAPSVRTERSAPADPARGLDFRSRRVDYQVPVPGDPGRWLTLAFATVAAEDADGELPVLLVDLFDAVMTTFRWRTR
ncbi:hypothetical protein ACWGJB_32910 [Streptomyces sp. NPDC054813]